ncbi:hypothetical protein [Mucilaginibacter celer]|uniref:hypothetical protein n=1 Tax=Mucilaginibacter celer TaxID=2305508 RepID=UPI0013CE8C9C|nr:hypothetical protein [Mucilaginibacter celer]
MKTEKENIDKPSTSKSAETKKVNPFKKLMEDKDRIADAVNKGQPLSTLKDIRFVHPL